MGLVRVAMEVSGDGASPQVVEFPVDSGCTPTSAAPARREPGWGITATGDRLLGAILEPCEAS